MSDVINNLTPSSAYDIMIEAVNMRSEANTTTHYLTGITRGKQMSVAKTHINREARREKRLSIGIYVSLATRSEICRDFRLLANVDEL